MVPVATGGPALGHRSHRLPHRALALLPAWQVADRGKELVGARTRSSASKLSSRWTEARPSAGAEPVPPPPLHQLRWRHWRPGHC